MGEVDCHTPGPEESHGHSLGVYAWDKDVANVISSAREVVVRHVK